MNSLTQVLLIGTVGLAAIGILMMIHDALISIYRLDAIFYTLPFG